MLLIFVLFNGLILASSIDLGGVLTGNRMGGAPLGLSMGVGEIDVEGVCMQQGITCQNCTHAITCVALPVGWLKIPLKECSDGETCNSRQGGCTKQHVPECEEKHHKFDHTCEQVGIFPDAYDCRKFHLCNPPIFFPDERPSDHRSVMCPRHYGYDPHTAQCSVHLKHGQCEKAPAPRCETLGQTTPLPDSPNHYIVCLYKYNELHPQVFLCPNGWFFWDGYCRPEPKPAETGSEQPIELPEKIQNDDNAVAADESDVFSYMNIFSTEPSTTVPVDNFLADKYDTEQYKMTIEDNIMPNCDGDCYDYSTY